MRIVAFIAHPDYTELFFGGTVIKHAMRGDEVYIVTLSPGERGHPAIPPNKLAKIRQKEMNEAAKIEGIKEVRILNFKDTEIFNTTELRLTLISMIRELKPDIVITHWPKDAHPDLRETDQAVIDACTYAVVGGIKTKHPPHAVRKVYTFGVPAGSVEFHPDIFVDISDVIEKKVAAAKCHKTMIEAFYNGDADKWTEGIYIENAFWGKESRVKYAEAFKEVNVAMYLGRSALNYLPS
ncbi:MAG: PIG-L deacetylase family protein [Candidatus Bathyarchaeia archaeon]